MEVLFIKINFIDMLNQYLANIVVLKNNLYTLHFNIIGEGSSDYHNTIGEYIVVLNNIYDMIAESIKKRGGFVLIDNNKINEISTIKSLTNKNYLTDEAKNTILHDFNTVNNMNNQLGDYSVKNREFDVFNIVLEFNKFLSKNIWFLTIEKY